MGLNLRLDKLLIRDSGGKRTRGVKVGQLAARCFVIRKSDFRKVDPDVLEESSSEDASDEF